MSSDMILHCCASSLVAHGCSGHCVRSHKLQTRRLAYAVIVDRRLIAELLSIATPSSASLFVRAGELIITLVGSHYEYVHRIRALSCAEG